MNAIKRKKNIFKKKKALNFFKFLEQFITETFLIKKPIRENWIDR